MNTTIVALGNAGGNIVDSARKTSKNTELSEAKYIFMDDDEHDLSLHDPEGKESICLSKENITKNPHLFEESERVIFVAGFGGLTSEKYLEQLVDAAVATGVRSISVIATTPFGFEGKIKIQRAVDLSKRLSEIQGLQLALYNNEDLVSKYEDLTFFNAFEIADNEIRDTIEKFV